MKRRKVLKQLGSGLLTTPLIGGLPGAISACSSPNNKKSQPAEKVIESPWDFDISLAQWSLHNTFFGQATMEKGWGYFREVLLSDPDQLLQGEKDPVLFPAMAKNDFGISAIELVNTFYFSKGSDEQFWLDFRKTCDSEGVQSLLIMCDAEGNLGDLDSEARKTAIENHYKWINAAKIMGCHAIRVNAAGNGTAEEVKAAAIDGLGQLSEYAEKENINIIVENHGSYSSDGMWLADIMKQINRPNCGTLPDFGNFCIEKDGEVCLNEYDRYKGMAELMPYAKGVSAKSHDFDEMGQETNTDFGKMLQIVKDAGFKGVIGVEYEGKSLSEPEGIMKTKDLLLSSKASLA